MNTLQQKESDMRFHIKNMVCDRCILIVTRVFTELGHAPVRIVLGEVDTASDLDDAEQTLLREQLASYGFQLVDDVRSRTVNAIKSLVVQWIHREEAVPRQTFSSLLSEQLHKDYSTLSSLFSETEGITLEKFIILQKVEKVKELLEYEELTLTEIAGRLGYANVSYLSGQFRKVTGITPSQYRSERGWTRKPLDRL